MHNIWAVARNTLAQTLRMKIAVVVILLLVIMLPLMSMVMEGDGTLLGKLQTFTSYGLGLISLLLSVLTISISCFTLSDDLKRKYIFLVVSKPIRRAELILGKLLGIVLLNLLLLILFSAILYACTSYMSKTEKTSPAQLAKAQREFFTARMGMKAKLDQELLKKRARERYDQLSQQRQIPEEMTYASVLRELYGQEVMKSQKVDPGEVKQWEFENVRVANADDPNTFLFIRYKYQVTSTIPDENVYGLWQVGDLRQLKTGGRIKTPIYNFERSQAVNIFQEFSVPADAIASDGYIAISFLNSPAYNQTTIIPEDLELLYKAGTFTGNFFRAVLMILVRLVFLTILGVSLTTWLSFPVSILICLIVFFAGLTNGFILDSIGSLGATAGMIYSLTIKPLLWFLPQFDGDFNPNRYIVDGRTLQWNFLAINTTITLFVKGMIVLLAGILIFSRREVAKTTA